MPRLSLSTRAFLLSFAPVCLALAASFIALNAAVHERVRQELRESLESSDEALNRASVEYARRTAPLLAKLTDSAGLKAAVGLLGENRGDFSQMAQVRATIEAQLRDLQASSTYELLAISDLHGKTVAAVLPDASARSALPTIPPTPGLAAIQNVLYRLERVPVVIAGEPAAALTLGARFDLTALPLAGNAVLLANGEIVRSTFPPQLAAAIEKEVAAHCPVGAARCELALQDQTFVVSELERAQLGPGYRLLGFRSLDERLRAFNAAFLRILIQVGCAGMLLALFATLLTSRSVSQPLRSLVAQLRAGESTGHLPDRLSARNGVRELDALANAFNRVADAERHSRRELERARDAAESASRLKTEFLTNVSHELRTPLNGVLGMAGVLLETPLAPDQRECAAVVRDCAESLAALIDNILEFSQLQSGQLELSPAPFALADLLASIAAPFRSHAAARGLELRVLAPEPPPPMLLGDANRIRQALAQLVENAIKFTERGHVHIRGRFDIEAGTTSLTIAVEDTGIGIPPGIGDFIFEKFSQADGSLTRRHGGTGIGLPLARQLIERMGGEIGFESQIQRGSTFWVRLPLPIAAPEPTESPGTEPPVLATVC